MSRCVGPEPGRACLTAALLLLAAGRACADDPAAAAQQAAERDIRALRALFQAGLPEQIVQPPVDNRQQAEQQEQQIAQQAKQLERMLQPIFHVELEVIRNACGELERDARQRILTAGRGAVEATAREFARRQFTGGLDGGFDPRGEIRRALEKAVAEAVPPDELAAYRREQEARVARRAAAARLAIISKLDRQLELSGAALENLHQTCSETGRHLQQVKEIGEKFGLGFLGLGMWPDKTREALPIMPKGRYAIMLRHMPRVGTMGLDMMLRTCTVQSNLD